LYFYFIRSARLLQPEEDVEKLDETQWIENLGDKMPQHLVRQRGPCRSHLLAARFSKLSFGGASMHTRTQGILAYLLIAFGIAWVNWEIVLRHGFSVSSPLNYPGSFAPAIAAFVVRKWISREGFADSGLRLNLRKWRYYLVAWLLPLALVGWIVVLAPLLGLGKPDYSCARGITYMIHAGISPSKLGHPWLLVVFLPIQAILATPVLFGEEFGWRGYLQPKLFPGSPVVSAVVTGLIWAAWHLPVNLRGYNFPDHPYIGSLIVFPLGAIFLSVIFGWLFLRAGSIWSSSLAHAAFNVIGGTVILLLFGGTSLLFISPGGILALIPLGALSSWIVFTGQLKSTASQPSESALAQAVRAGV
jgi:uncharacterized protein